ncbi:hypothetical protein JM654_03815 [Microbacterium oxydans]|nr:hypothetical protein [Microbacterium oxydans]
MWTLWSHESITGNELGRAWAAGDPSWSMNLSGTGGVLLRVQGPRR